MQIKTYPARQAKNCFGEVLEAAQRAPVRITRNGRPVGGFIDQYRFDALVQQEKRQAKKQLCDAFRVLCAEVDAAPKPTLPEAMELLQTDEAEVLELLGEDYFRNTA
ncbi:MAG: type II toxin-antitoxin system prevent-host-death family antitoxin [Pseudomonadota bacterium]